MFYKVRITAALRKVLLVPACLLSVGLSAQPPAKDAKTADSKADAVKTELAVRFLDSKPKTLQIADLDSLPQKSVKVHDQSGQEITYSGAALVDVMQKAGMNFKENLHGKYLTAYLLVEAADKYRVLFALPEFDPNYTDKLILVATKKDGKLLSPEEGPFRFIVPDDKRPARWIRQVRMLSLRDSVSLEDRNQKP